MDMQSTHDRSLSAAGGDERLPEVSLQPHEPIRVRDASIADAAAIAKVHVEGWRSAYVGIVPDDHLKGLSLEAYERRWERDLSEVPKRADWFCLVASRAQLIVGFIEGGRARKPEYGFLGEIYSLYVWPPCWRQGIGQHLLTRSFELFHERAFPGRCVHSERQPLP